MHRIASVCAYFGQKVLERGAGDHLGLVRLNPAQLCCSAAFCRTGVCSGQYVLIEAPRNCHACAVVECCGRLVRMNLADA